MGVVLQVVAHQWGDDVKDLLPGPDLITGADIVYQAEHFAALIQTLQDLAAPHTLIYLAFKLRGKALEKQLCLEGHRATQTSSARYSQYVVTSRWS